MFLGLPDSIGQRSRKWLWLRMWGQPGRKVWWKWQVLNLPHRGLILWPCEVLRILSLAREVSVRYLDSTLKMFKIFHWNFLSFSFLHLFVTFLWILFKCQQANKRGMFSSNFACKISSWSLEKGSHNKIIPSLRKIFPQVFIIVFVHHLSRIVPCKYIKIYLYTYCPTMLLMMSK